VATEVINGAIPTFNRLMGPAANLFSKWRKRIVLVSLIVGGILAAIFRPERTNTNLVQVTLVWYEPLGSIIGGGTWIEQGEWIQSVNVQNKSGGMLLMWDDLRIERKDTGEIIEARLLPSSWGIRSFCIGGTNSRACSCGPLHPRVKGTNHGPWRVLLPTVRYQTFARLEWLLKKSPKNSSLFNGWLCRYRLVDTLLRYSRFWVASDWFDDPRTRYLGEMRGTIEEVTEKSGGYRKGRFKPYCIRFNGQRLNTYDPRIVELARENIGRSFKIIFSESDDGRTIERFCFPTAPFLDRDYWDW
jgi:hypothetical protein